jgi:hypothetical protein
MSLSHSYLTHDLERLKGKAEPAKSAQNSAIYMKVCSLLGTGI